MITRAFAYLCAAAVIIAGGGAGSSQVTSKNRILRPVDAAQFASVRGTAHPMARVQFTRGRTETSRAVTAAISFRLSLTKLPTWDPFSLKRQDQTSPNY